VRIVPPDIIVMYSSDPRIKTEQFALEAGAHAYFAKGDPSRRRSRRGRRPHQLTPERSSPRFAQ
jgi:hypothetical protein